MERYITAKELAEELLKNPDDIVCVTSSNFEMGSATIPLSYDNPVYRYKGKIENRNFKDAFDSGIYSSETVLYDENGNINIAKI